MAESPLFVLAVMVAFLPAMLIDEFQYERLAIAAKLFLQAKRRVRSRQQHTASEHYRRTVRKGSLGGDQLCDWMAEATDVAMQLYSAHRGPFHGERRSRHFSWRGGAGSSMVALDGAGNQSSMQRSLRLLRCHRLRCR